MKFFQGVPHKPCLHITYLSPQLNQPTGHNIYLVISRTFACDQRERPRAVDGAEETRRGRRMDGWRGGAVEASLQVAPTYCTSYCRAVALPMDVRTT